MKNQYEFNERFADAISSFEIEAKSIIGREVRILSNYNGQDYGKSKPSLKGRVFKITSVHLDSVQGLFIGIEGFEYSPMLEETEWEFVE